MLTLTPLTWKIWWAHNNASRWQMRFNSAFKGLKWDKRRLNPLYSSKLRKRLTIINTLNLFAILLSVHLGIFIFVIDQLDAQNICFTISLFHASTCFAHMCSSSGGQNCITQPATYRCDDIRGCVMQFWPPDDEHMCSKHVEAWNKLTVKQKFCASSWLITEINILTCTVSKTSKK